jgi:hypothetical protein
MSPIPLAAPAPTSREPPHEQAGLGALLATVLVAAVVLSSLLYLVQPWRRRSNLPRARARRTRPDDEA